MVASWEAQVARDFRHGQIILEPKLYKQTIARLQKSEGVLESLVGLRLLKGFVHERCRRALEFGKIDLRGYQLDQSLPCRPLSRVRGVLPLRTQTTVLRAVVVHAKSLGNHNEPSRELASTIG